MSNRATWFGRLCRRDEFAARDEMILLIKRHDGSVPRIAAELGFSPRHVARYLWRLALTDFAHEHRARAAAQPKPPTHIERARAALAATSRVS